MQKHQDNLASRINGNSLQPLSGVTVTVVNDATGLPAALYSDNGVTLITAPIITDDNGGYSFYAADGKYTVTYASSRLAGSNTRKLILEDPLDNPTASLAQLAASGGGALVSTIASGTGAVVRSTQAKLRDIVNIKDFGAASTNTNAQNKTALQAAITAINAAGGGRVVVDFDINYGLNFRDLTTYPSFVGCTTDIVVDDRANGTADGTNKLGAQHRLFANTNQTSPVGQHDGNYMTVHGAWAPGIGVNNIMDLAAAGAGSRLATDNRRAYFAIYNDGICTWQIGQGTRIGAGLTDEEMSNFCVQMFNNPGDTMANFTAYLVERKTGNASYGGGRNIPSAHHHFEAVSGSPSMPEMMVESRDTVSDLYLRTVTGSGRDMILRNTDGVFSVRTPVGDAYQIDYVTRRTWVAGSLQLRRVAQTYGTTVTIDTTVGNIYPITATNGTAFTIAAPLTPSDGMEITLTIINTSGGALGAITWNAVFKMAAWTSPATGFNRSITFYYNGTNWVEKTRTASDIPN